MEEDERKLLMRNVERNEVKTSEFDKLEVPFFEYYRKHFQN